MKRAKLPLSERETFIQDLEAIFEKSMAAEKWSVALKVKEILGKIKGITPSSGAANALKPIALWSEAEIEDLIQQLEHNLDETFKL